MLFLDVVLEPAAVGLEVLTVVVGIEVDEDGGILDVDGTGGSGAAVVVLEGKWNDDKEMVVKEVGVEVVSSAPACDGAELKVVWLPGRVTVLGEVGPVVVTGITSSIVVLVCTGTVSIVAL